MPYYYHADIRVDGMLWHHFKAQPSSQFYISQIPPVIHNYGLTLALAGFIVDPDIGYVSKFNVKKYKKPVELYKRYGVYAYPPLVSRAVLGEVLMAGNNEGLLMVRGQSRLAYPFFTKNVVLMPGSMLRTLLISEHHLPSKMVINIGAKRMGVLIVRLTSIKPQIVEQTQVTHPFNTDDVVNVYNYATIMTHEAGNIGMFGVAERALKYQVGVGKRLYEIVLPLIRR